MANIKLIATLIVILCLISVPVFYKTKSYIKTPGVFLFFLVFSTLIFRISLNSILHISFYQESSFLLSLLLLLVVTVSFLTIVLTQRDIFFKRKKYFIKLLLPYLLFGALQQVYFLVIFTDAALFLVHSKLVLLIISTGFFVTFHLGELKKLILMFTFLGFLSSHIYIYLGNAIPQMIFHGFIGSIIFTVYSKENQFKKRLG